MSYRKAIRSAIIVDKIIIHPGLGHNWSDNQPWRCSLTIPIISATEPHALDVVNYEWSWLKFAQLLWSIARIDKNLHANSTKISSLVACIVQ